MRLSQKLYLRRSWQKLHQADLSFHFLTPSRTGVSSGCENIRFIKLKSLFKHLEKVSMADAAEQARKAVALTGLYSWNSSTSPLPGHSVRGYLTEIHDASTGGELQKIAALAQRTCVLPGSEPRLFLEHGLRAAISAGRMDSARYLMSLGAKVTNVPSPGNAALQSGNVEMFQLLVDNGWDVNSMEGLDGPVIA